MSADCPICFTDHDEERLEQTQFFRHALMEVFFDTWTMNNISDAAHVCGAAVVQRDHDHKENFQKSFEIACPECEAPPHTACIMAGANVMQHSARTDSVR